MFRGVWTLGVLVLTLAVGLTFPLQAAQAQNSQDYPYQGQSHFTLDGTVTQVDTDRDRVLFNGDNGRHYTLDTYQSNIVLRGTGRRGETGDLTPRMRLHVDGTLLSSDIIEADTVRVLALAARPIEPVPAPGAEGGSGPLDQRNSGIRLRGSVQSVDQDQGSFVVRVNGHTRTVYVDLHTDLHGLRPDSPDDLPLQRGDRVSVTGTLNDDGTVLADAVTFNRDLTASDPYRRLRSLTGRVTAQSNRFTSRDIKIRVADDREVKIKVPGGIPVRRDGHPISVHELSKSDVVRVYGVPDGDAFRASRVEVLETYGGDY